MDGLPRLQEREETSKRVEIMTNSRKLTRAHRRQIESERYLNGDGQGLAWPGARECHSTGVKSKPIA